MSTMAATPLHFDPFSSSSFDSIFSHTTSRQPDDTVFFSIHPDFVLSTTTTATDLSCSLQFLHVQILQTVSSLTVDYIWQHEPFALSIATLPCFCSSSLPHLHGKLRFGDNLDDEWFVVFLLYHISLQFPSLSIRVWDSDGEFLLIEAAFHLPKWVNPENSLNRVFIRGGHLHIIPRNRLSNPSLFDALKFLLTSGDDSRGSDPVQHAIQRRVSEYPEKARRSMHRVRVRVPVSVAQVLKHEPSFVSLAVEGFYDRDIDAMKFAAKMKKFLSGRKDEALVCVPVRMSRAMYAQLVQQKFQAPKCYPMPNMGDASVYVEAELGMKMTCGFEMMYQQRWREGEVGKGSTWEAFKESLDKSGYFQGLLPGSKEYKRLLQNAEEYYKNSAVFSRASEMMSAPVRHIDEILALPHSADDFKRMEVPPSDDDSWLYSGEEELNYALKERQEEFDLYNVKHGKKERLKRPQGQEPSSSSKSDEFNPGDMAKTMQSFVRKMSSYKGAEFPENGNKEVDIDVDQFIKDMESIMKQQDQEDANDDVEEGSSDLDFDDTEDESDMEADTNEDEENSFMHSYIDALNEELKDTTLKNSFVRANEQRPGLNEGSSNETQNTDGDFSPVDVNVNLVKSFLDSFSSQEGRPGPASNLLGIMGIQFPQDTDKGK